MIKAKESVDSLVSTPEYNGVLNACRRKVYIPSGIETFPNSTENKYSDKRVLFSRNDVETAVAEMYAELGPASPQRHADLVRKINIYERALADFAKSH